MNYIMILPVLISFAISAALGPVVIPLLRRLKFGQTVREEGPKSHLKKSGTPTMGGLIILAGIVITSLLYVKDYPEIIPILFVTVGFGIIGFLDDYIKIVLHRSEGLTPGQKMLGQILVTGIFVYYYYNLTGGDMEMLIPFWPEHYFTVVAFGTHSGISPITCAVVGSLMGFLLFNVYPASVFMGDTGSLALGGFVASTAYMLKMPIFILIVALIYWIEILSVMIQVTYFKLTGGKRIFRMAPIHHHFELGGWSETRVVAVFSIVTAVLCLIGILAL